MTKNKGFTLIELLVVIAIIGILSSVVLASVSSARSRANDAKAKGQLASMRGAAEIYFTGATNYSGTATTPVDCTGAMFTDSTSGMAALATIGNYPSTSQTMDCGANGTAWSVAVSLSSGAWCVDSTGVSRGTKSNGTTAYAADSTVTGSNAVVGSASAAHTAAKGTVCN